MATKTAVETTAQESAASTAKKTTAKKTTAKKTAAKKTTAKKTAASNRKLVIVESPAKAKTIKKYLGRGYEVVASMGHTLTGREKRSPGICASF